MSRIGLIAVLAVAGVAIACPAAAQNYPGGQTPDPFSYEGNMVLERERAAKAQAENDAMQKRLDDNYKYYAPGGPGGVPAAGGGGGGAGGGRSVPPLKSRPLLPAAKNPLLGMWRMGVARPLNLSAIPMFPGTDKVVNGALGGICESILGKPDTVIRFTPTQLNWVAPDGHDEILNRVEYRSDGANIIVIPLDSDLAMIFGMSNHDNAVAAFFGCTMSRTNTSARLGPAAPAAGYRGGGTVAPSIAAGQAILNLTVGQTINGTFSAPPAGTQIFVTNQNPDVNLVKAGFAGPQPVEALFLACKSPAQGGNQDRCKAGQTALLGGALGVTTTDPNGHAQTGAIPPGHYYLVGSTPYQGHSLVWHMPVELKPGANSVALTPQNGSISH